MLVISIVILASALSGCGGKPFNVKPRPEKPHAEYRAKGAIDDVTIHVDAVTDEDYLYETFDANLILASVYPVRVMATNNGSQALELGRARFEVRNGTGRRFKALDPRRAYKRLISYYGISVYNKDGYKRSLVDFTSHGLDTGTPLGPGESRQGVVFFAIPAEVVRDGGLIFAARLNAKHAKTDPTLELKLN